MRFHYIWPSAFITSLLEFKNGTFSHVSASNGQLE